ncbi:MAG TPA: heavy metal translocating P-type ATPase [Rhodanobacteraceae bacterium]|nr:heavy metal translocating P-type ATPase [Rhodanobacteraceae bacterium]
MSSTAAALWSRPALAAQALRPRHDGRAELGLRVPALADPRRALRLEQSLCALPGVTRVRPDIVARRLRLVLDTSQTSLTAVLEHCAASGCPAEPLPAHKLDDQRSRDASASLRRLLVAGLFAMQAMSFALVLYLSDAASLGADAFHLFRWLGLLSAVPVVSYAALPFYRHALQQLRAGRAGIDVPVAIAVLAIFSASVIATVHGNGEVYFDSVSMFVFVLLIGRHLELRARHRQRAVGEAALDATPLVAERRLADGTLEVVAVAELAPGDRVHVAEAGVVPADGTLLNARVALDESLWSGESAAVSHSAGAAIRAGSLVLEGPLELALTRHPGEGTAAQLAALSEQAATETDATRADSDASARRFVWRVLLLTLATALFWLWLDPGRAFDATVAVIVVACPCAFGLAAPASLTRALTVLSRAGVQLTRPRALHCLADGGHALFDKTGTLTEPDIDASAIETAPRIAYEQAIAWAAALARESRHPMAQAIARLHPTAGLPHADAVETLAGNGVQARIDGHRVRLGRAGFAAPGSSDDALLLADDDGVLARFPIHEQLRTEAASTIRALKAHGFTPHIASGDSPTRVARVAAALDVHDWRARQTPADKLATIRQWQGDGHATIAIGDGSNDAPALAAADASVSLIGATELARQHADLLLGRGLAGLVAACDTARNTQRVLRQNRRWSLLYNLAAIPFAAAGLVPPWLAAIGMSLSSLAVVLNSLRINTRGRQSDAP